MTWDVTSEQPDPPAVSVLVKTYNHAAYIGRTIASVLEQSFQDFEIVVTDDASSDGTAGVVRGFADPRVSLSVLPRNLGISGAMNATLARARGRYFAILNSDDWALPDRLRRQVAFLDRHPEVSLVFGMPETVDETGRPATAHNDFAAALRLPDFSRRSWLRQFFFAGNCLCAPTVMIRREAYQAAGPYDRRLTNLQDLDMWIRMLLAGHRIHVLKEPVTAVRIRAGLANMSAPRPDTLLRSGFEAGKVLRHFAGFRRELFQEVFDVWSQQEVALLALRDPRLEYKQFGLDLLYETACGDDDFDRLRALTGTVDARGTGMIRELCESLRSREAVIAQLTGGARRG